jgi:xanthine dehydrogenase iron-sulfur cluster and FAD-binding subunit A
LSEQEIREGLEGNLCRCTGYHNIVKAIAAAWGVMHGGEMAVAAELDADGRAGSPRGPAHPARP